MPAMSALPIDAIATIFIFMIGLPAILLQTLPADIRYTILHERKSEVVLFTVGPLVLAGLMVTAGVLLTYPDDPPVPAIARHGGLFWLGLVAALLLVSGTSALVFTERWRRNRVIEHLLRDAARGIDSLGRPVERALRTLMHLGIQSRAGQDKGLVIDALAELTRATQASDKYDGSQLEDVISGLEDLFTAGDHGGSAGNFMAAASLLLELIMDSSDRTHSDDLKGAVRAVSVLGRLSLGHEQYHIQLKFLDALGWAGEATDPTWASQALLELGSDALAANSMLIAMTALDKLDTVVGKHSPVSGDLAEDFIGLLAHFWVRHETGKVYAREYLARADQLFQAPLPDVIRDARTRSMSKARFNTCDYLSRMLADLERG